MAKSAVEVLEEADGAFSAALVSLALVLSRDFGSFPSSKAAKASSIRRSRLSGLDVLGLCRLQRSEQYFTAVVAVLADCVRLVPIWSWVSGIVLTQTWN